MTTLIKSGVTNERTLYNRHGMFIRHLTIIVHSPVTLPLISLVIRHTTIIVRSPVTPVTPLLISVVICHTTVPH
jgi:hypothetical protein